MSWVRFMMIIYRRNISKQIIFLLSAVRLEASTLRLDIVARVVFVKNYCFSLTLFGRFVLFSFESMTTLEDFNHQGKMLIQFWSVVEKNNHMRQDTLEIMLSTKFRMIPLIIRKIETKCDIDTPLMIRPRDESKVYSFIILIIFVNFYVFVGSNRHSKVVSVLI